MLKKIYIVVKRITPVLSVVLIVVKIAVALVALKEVFPPL